jgi:CRP/FNR family transcriptional regulator, cyclic AMP receptor protein
MRKLRPPEGGGQASWVVVLRDTIEEMVFLPEQEIFAQGDHGDAMYLVREGAVVIWVGTSASPTLLATLSQGSIFGESALMNDAPRMAHAKSGPRGCAVVAVPRAAFTAKMDKSDPMVVGVARLLIDTMCTANGEVGRLRARKAELEGTVLPLRQEAATLRPAVVAARSALAQAQRENTELRKVVLSYIDKKKARGSGGAP